MSLEPSVEKLTTRIIRNFLIIFYKTAAICWNAAWLVVLFASEGQRDLCGSGSWRKDLWESPVWVIGDSFVKHCFGFVQISAATEVSGHCGAYWGRETVKLPPPPQHCHRICDRFLHYLPRPVSDVLETVYATLFIQITSQLASEIIAHVSLALSPNLTQNLTKFLSLNSDYSVSDGRYRHTFHICQCLTKVALQCWNRS
jgi:hypothetical protein